MKPEFTMKQIVSFDNKGYRSVAARMVRSLLQHMNTPKEGKDYKKIRVGCPTCKHDDYNSGRVPGKDCPHAETCGSAFKHWEEYTQSPKEGENILKSFELYYHDEYGEDIVSGAIESFLKTPSI